MRMSPRLKARRGRFGPGGLSAPTLVIVSPGNNATFGPGSPANLPNFVGTARDDLDGNISANIDWHVLGGGAGPGSPPTHVLPAGSPSAGDATGASVDLTSFFTTGSPVTGSPKVNKAHTVFATVVDAGGKRSTVSISITIAAT